MPLEKTITTAFITLLSIKLFIQLILNIRNQFNILKNRNNVPESFTEKISLEEHQKAADYTLTKGKFGRWCLLLEVVMLYLWTLGGGLDYLYNLFLPVGPFLHNIFNQTSGTIFSEVLFFLSFTIVSLLIGLPQSIYSTFVIEENFGFNKTTPKIFILDLVKQIILSFIFIIPIFSLFIYLWILLGEHWWLYGWIVFITFQFFIMWIYPTLIAPLFNKFTPLKDQELLERIEALVKKCGFSSKGIFTMDASKRSKHGNAYFTGFGKNKRIVFFDTLLETITPSELEAILAHELGHFKLRHILKNLIISIVMSFAGFWVLGTVIKWTTFYTGHNVPFGYAPAIILFLLVSPIYTFLLTPIFSYFSRKDEFAADKFAKQHANGEDLINSLVKLYKENASTLTPDPIYSAFYYSHPPINERISQIKNLEI